MAENVQLRRSATELNAECEKHKKTNDGLSSEADKLRMSVKKLSVQLNQKQEDINKLAQNNKVMDQEIKDQNSYIAKLHSDNNRISNENSQLKKLQDDYMKESAQLWEQNKGLKSQLNEARGMIEVLNNDIEVSKQHINDLMPENENLRQYVDELKRKLEQAMDDNRKVMQDYEVVKAQDTTKMQICVEENRRLKEEVGKLKVDKEKLKVV
jgi:chromosome segregation ATPase